MKSKRLFIAAIFMLLFNLTLNAQVKPVSDKEVFFYKADKIPPAVLPMLEKLCKANGKNISAINFGFSLEKNLAVDGSQKSLKVVIKPADFKGEFQYKGFHVGNYLIPKSLSYKVLESGDVFADVQKSDLVAGLYTEKIPVSEGAHKFKISKVNFIYSDNQVAELVHQFEMIDAYPGLKKEIEAIDGEITGSNFSDAAKIFENEQKLRSLESKLHKFSKYNQELNLADYDPDGFRSAYYEAVNHLEQAKEYFENSAKDIHVIFYKKGLELMEEGKSNTAILYFSQAANRKPDYAAPHVQLARIAYTNGDFDLVENELLKALQSVKLDEESRDYAVALFTDLFWYFLKSGDSHLNALDFELAVAEYKKAEKILEQKIVPQENREVVEEKTAKARNDQFEFMLSEARFKVFQNHLDAALKDLRTADDFVKNYGKFVNDAAQSKEVYQFLFEKAVEYAEQYNEGKNFVKAASELKIAEQIFDMNDNAALISRYRKAVYEANLGLSAKMLENDKLAPAVDYLHSAELAIQAESNAGALTAELKKRKKALLDKYFAQKIEASKSVSEPEEKRKIAKELILLVIKYGYSPVAEQKDAYNQLVQDFGN